MNLLPSLSQFLALDLAALLTASLCSVTCAVVGAFLVLRRQALLGDAIAHSVLPGLGAAFLITGSRGSLPMFAGALVAGVMSVVLSDWLRRRARVEGGAAMAVVFSALFAAGVLAMSLPRMRTVDLDADCVLNGVLETILWTADTARGTRAPASIADLVDPAVLAGAPRQLVVALVVCVAVIALVALLFKELRLTSFDPALAAALGFRPGLVNTLLVVLVAACSVASFEAVGSILVIAMLICPAVAARMLTDRLWSQVVLSAVLSLIAAVAGYFAGAFGPRLFDGEGAPSLSAAGMISATLGLLVALTVVFSPRHGVIARRVRRLGLALSILRQDLLAMLYRVEEAGQTRRLTARQAVDALGAPLMARLALRAALRAGQAAAENGSIVLTERGRDGARSLVRTHRLWEIYLVDTLGWRADHVHRPAMDLEHHTTPDIEAELETATRAAATLSDPHGRPLPERPGHRG